ncbi:hypothetical protein EAX61_06710 [Dokdonia sinensis]|uniref:DUF4382 domain-containing protein n=1 Tax=Dokdonia sinensis TaxID=2479847 RepID=A0A3M0G8M8_9FLAO|nr:hypothetical protein [Dokdonia sinensis]RMB60507.1 hypothetical protein EAX61_06710 [Dokdonia sinensis]
MKRSFLLLLIFSLAIFTFASCNDSEDSDDVMEMGTDDDQGDDENEESTKSYFSTTQGNRWVYDVSVDQMPATRDTLIVVAPVNQDGTQFTDLEASETSTGFMTGLLSNGLITEDNARLTYTGSITVPVDPTNPFTIDIPASVVYDESQIAGTVLSVNEQTITQDLNGFPITIDVTAETRQLGVVQNYTVGTMTFDSVIQSELAVSATISTVVVGIPVTVLVPQEVLVATNTYAEDIGLVDSTVSFQYEFIDLTPFGITFPFPPTASNVTTQQAVDIMVTN